jgi:hypothetical protein
MHRYSLYKLPTTRALGWDGEAIAMHLQTGIKGVVK